MKAMTAISANLVKELREKTGAGMMDCKKALTEAGGDVEQAVDWLRKKGLAAAAKKAGRVATEGLVGVAVAGKVGAVVEVNSETDFVARNEQFQAFVAALATHSTVHGADIETLKVSAFPGTGRTVAEEATHMIATIGENIQLRRSVTLSVTNGVVTSYVHNSLRDGLGKIGVLVALESTADAGKLNDLGRQIAMHIAAAKPESLTTAELDPTLIEREKSVLIEQSRASGKPENIIEKMVEGRLRKYYEEVVLLEQVFVIDGESRITQVLEKASKDLGAPVAITGFARFNLGEGLEKEESDFAAEVAASLAS
jgi:elongation factor Ts